MESDGLFVFSESVLLCDAKRGVNTLQRSTLFCVSQKAKKERL